MLVELSPEELTLIGEALVHRAATYNEAASIKPNTGLAIEFDTMCRAKADALTAVHVKTLQYSNQPRRESPEPGDLIRSTRIVDKVFPGSKQFTTKKWVDELPTLYPGWRHRVERTTE